MDYELITKKIGNLLNVNPDYIRLYYYLPPNKIYDAPIVRYSDKKILLLDILNSNYQKKSNLIYEITSLPVKDIEKMNELTNLNIYSSDVKLVNIFLKKIKKLKLYYPKGNNISDI
jgi:hypothetical protein